MDHCISLGTRFFKGHGHGNDYLVFQEGPGWAVTSEAVQILCDRHRGVGSDGIVALLGGEKENGPSSGDGSPTADPPFRLRMFNPDGSEFERSGNGLRIFASYLHSEGKVGLGKPFSVEVGGETVGMEILEEGGGAILQVAVEMGSARFGFQAVGADPQSFGPDLNLEGPGGGTLATHLVSMGNPHCVVFRENLLEEELGELGPFLSSHEAFTHGTNVQLAKVRGEGKVEILIWERGVGRTSSSGTSASAVAAAGVAAGFLRPGPIEVGMEGGGFVVTVSPEMAVRLEGPVQPLFRGELERGFLESLI